ncbi:MAG: hypothetical protein RBT71_06000 [Flavobacteriales bacterium]|nr:hypothetical protein [Flavobacteriales bacterium]
MSKDGSSTNAANVTKHHGVFAFLLKDPLTYTLHGSWALIENPTVFQEHTHVFGVEVSAIHGNGRASHRLLNWLAQQHGSDYTLLHLPDYDPTGLNDFLRLYKLLGDRVQLHLPPNLEALFDNYGDAGLLTKDHHRNILRNLRKSQHPSVARVVELMDHYNAGLEQEALLIP